MNFHSHQRSSELARWMWLSQLLRIHQSLPSGTARAEWMMRRPSSGTLAVATKVRLGLNPERARRCFFVSA